jgi:DNA-binding IclR family transcriptional regulator
VGSQWPLHATATGKVLLAGLPPDSRQPLLAGKLEVLTPHTLTAPDALAQALHQIQTQGYALADQELELGYVSVAGPVRNHEGQVIAALSVGGPSARLTPEKLAEIIALVKAEAEWVSAQLGYRIDK